MSRRILALLHARLREFYRDKASFLWNLVMPLLLVIAFAFVFDNDRGELFKIGYLGEITDSPLHRTAHLQFIPFEDAAVATQRLRRHQLDLLLDLRAAPRYWVNEQSSRSYLAERLLRDAHSTAAGAAGSPPPRASVQGEAIRYVDWVMPGILAMNLMFSCYWGVGWIVVRYRKNGVLRRLRTTPLRAWEFLTAQILSRLLISLGVAAAVLVLAVGLLDVVMRGSALALALLYLCAAACFSALGLLVATRLRSEELTDGLLNLFSWPMLLLSGVWFSMEGTSEPAQWLSELLPLTHLVDASRRVMVDGAGTLDVLPEAGLLLALAAVLLGAAAWLFRWE